MKNCAYRLSLEELLSAKSGLLVLRGAEGENESGEPNGSSEEEGDDDKSKSGENGEDKDKGKKAEPTAADRKIASLEEEKQRHYDKRTEAEAEVKSLKLEIKKLQKDGTPDDAVKNENATLAKENESLKASNQKLALANAFLTNNTHSWVDADAAMRLADLSAVEIDEKGKVIGLTSALDKLAKDKPYLLKAKVEDKEDDPKKPRRTGTPPKPGTQKDADKVAAEAKLRQKYPALRR